MALALKVICPTAKGKFCPTSYFVAGVVTIAWAKYTAYQRHCERSEAIHLTAQRKYGLLRRKAPRNDDCWPGRQEKIRRRKPSADRYIERKSLLRVHRAFHRLRHDQW
jgi:hypothetical protein